MFVLGQPIAHDLLLNPQFGYSNQAIFIVTLLHIVFLINQLPPSSASQGFRAGTQIPHCSWSAASFSSGNAFRCLTSSGCSAPRSDVRQPCRSRSGPMLFAVPAALAMSIGWSMTAGCSATSAGTAAIRPRSRLARSCRPETKLPLTIWFLASYLIGQAKIGFSSLELSRHLGVKYDTA